MVNSRIINSATVLLFCFVFSPFTFASLFLTMDLDLCYQNTDFKKEELKLKGLGFSLRRVFADTRGDRFILFTLIDFVDNFQETMLDQAYIQYKGPLGKYNFTLGRYILPFGLLPNYSTKRLLIKTLEYETVGISRDSGIQISGVLRDFDYAFSLSQGIGINRWTDIDNELLTTFRLGYQGADFEDLRVGLSGLLGRVMPDKMHSAETMPTYKKLLALDLIKYYGPMVWRTEMTLGEEEHKSLYGIFLGLDYALLPKVELNLGYTHLDKAEHRKEAITVGVTYNLFAGLQIRIAQKFSLRGDEDVLSFQVYNIFTRAF